MHQLARIRVAHGASRDRGGTVELHLSAFDVDGIGELLELVLELVGDLGPTMIANPDIATHIHHIGTKRLNQFTQIDIATVQFTQSFQLEPIALLGNGDAHIFVG